MEKTTLISDLTDTQILSAIREMFAGRRVAAIELQPLINQSQTLADLYANVRKALDEFENSKI